MANVLHGVRNLSESRIAKPAENWRLQKHGGFVGIRFSISALGTIRSCAESLVGIEDGDVVIAPLDIEISV